MYKILFIFIIILLKAPGWFVWFIEIPPPTFYFSLHSQVVCVDLSPLLSHSCFKYLRWEGRQISVSKLYNICTFTCVGSLLLGGGCLSSLHMCVSVLTQQDHNLFISILFFFSQNFLHSYSASSFNVFF